MNNLDKIRKMAQADADREGKPLAILNLNQFSPLYVVRSYKPEMANSPEFVELVQPNATSNVS